MTRQDGFTLIELLLVLAIIGIVSAIAIPTLLGQRENSRQRATEATASAVVAEVAATAKTQTSATTTTVMAYVRGLSSFAYPACKNAYTPTASPLTAAGAAGANGEVGMAATTQNDSNGTAINVIAVSYQHTASGGSKVLAYVPME